MGNLLKAFSNPFYRTSSLEILLFFAGWGIWWSFFQIWLTTKQGFTGAQVGTIYTFGSAVALVLMFVYGSVQDKLGVKKNLLIFMVSCQVLLAPFFTWVYVPMLESNFYVGAMVGAVYLSVAYRLPGLRGRDGEAQPPLPLRVWTGARLGLSRLCNLGPDGWLPVHHQSVPGLLDGLGCVGSAAGHLGLPEAGEL